MTDTIAKTVDWVDEASEESFPASDAPAWPQSGSVSHPHLERLVDCSRYDPYPLPDRLARLYGGAFGLPSPCLYSNFIASVDGVASLGPEHPHSGSAISGHNQADRFVMGFLRACADAVVIGAGTLRATPNHEWTPEQAFPDAARDLQELRRRLGRSARPHLYVLTARGDVDITHPALQRGATLITTERGAANLPSGVPVRVAEGDVSLDMAAILDVIHGDGHRVVLTEGGPTVIAQLLHARLLDQLFLTLAPRVLGRSATAYRSGLVEGWDWSADSAPRLELLSAHRQRDFLFLRYRCDRSDDGTPTR